MYILDEIDAALDLSHSRSFPRSSVLLPSRLTSSLSRWQPRTSVACSARASRAASSSSSRSRTASSPTPTVSPPSSLSLPRSFDRADVLPGAVLFRARFRDGTSIVERTSQRTASSLYDKENRGGGRERRWPSGQGRSRSGLARRGRGVRSFRRGMSSSRLSLAPFSLFRLSLSRCTFAPLHLSPSRASRWNMTHDHELVQATKRSLK